MKHINLLIKSILFFYLLNSVSAAQTTEELLADVNKNIQQINTEQLKNLLEKDKNVALIDIRAADEIAVMGGAIDVQQNIHIPRSWLEFRIADAVTNKQRPIVIYCGTGVRSPLATQTLMKMGYTNVSNYSDSFIAWKKADLPVRSPDQAPLSMLYRMPQQVIEGVWTAIGATAPPTYANSGHNNNLSFIISNEGVLVFNAGDNYLLAKALHDEIKKLTEQKVKYVVLENAQGHAMLGANYWREQGVEIIAHENTATKIKRKGQAILERMQRGRKDKAAHTQIVQPDRTFSDKLVIELGDKQIELLYFGPAHEHDDIILWLPEEQLLITGDLAFHQRLLPISDNTDTLAWLDAWEKLAALNARIVIPGHGDVTDMSEVTKYTRDYLLYMRQTIQTIIDNGGDLQDAYAVDQSQYAHLHTFKQLNTLNADRMFRAMEFE